MSSIALIHGYAVRLTSPVVRRGFGAMAGFRAFADDLESGEASVFRWGIEKDVPWWALIDPFAQYRFYRDELATAMDAETQGSLKEFLERERPSVIVAHSMGATLLHAFSVAHGLPSFVRKVVLVQADLPHDTDLGVFSETLNLYCPWDPTLTFSMLLSGRCRAGLCPMSGANVSNQLLPAYLLPNLHTSALRDSRLRDIVSGLR